MKKQFGILALAIIMVGGGCTQDVLTESDELTRIKPHVRSKEVPLNQAVILKPEDLSGSPEMFPMSSCGSLYYLQIKRISSVTGTVNLRVFSKDADGNGWSAVVNNIDFHNLSDTQFTTVLLYDGTDLICFESTDNVAFIQPFAFGQDIEFEARFYNGSVNTTPETIDWVASNRYYFTMYPDDAGDCQNLNPEYCCEYKITANIVGSSTTSSTMRFLSPWDNTQVNLDVPPEDTDGLVSDNCGPIVVTWNTPFHEVVGGSGEALFECDETDYQWEISEPEGVHGVIFDPYGRMCILRY